jgi:hypothetical protein
MPGRTGASGPDDGSTASSEARSRSAAWVWAQGFRQPWEVLSSLEALWTDRPVAASPWSSWTRSSAPGRGCPRPGRGRPADQRGGCGASPCTRRGGGRGSTNQPTDRVPAEWFRGSGGRRCVHRPAAHPVGVTLGPEAVPTSAACMPRRTDPDYPGRSGLPGGRGNWFVGPYRQRRWAQHRHISWPGGRPVHWPGWPPSPAAAETQCSPGRTGPSR